MMTAAMGAAQTPERMQWFTDARFGMFLHWGVYSAAGGEWKGATNHAEWLQFTAKIPIAEYAEFAAGFNPVKFNADDWARMAKDAGMRYIVITAKHHDGFAMYDSKADPYSVVAATRYKHDPLQDLAAAETLPFAGEFGMVAAQDLQRRRAQHQQASRRHHADQFLEHA